jgi:carbon-monoxide dehydrogenase large subunit
VGQALVEHAIYDKGSAQMLSATFMDYGMPRAELFPEIETHLEEVPSKTNPLGVKGIGESGTIGAPPTVINAILDALKPYGVDKIDMPATPARVWDAMQAARKNSGGASARA